MSSRNDQGLQRRSLRALLAAFATLSLMVSFAACGNDDEDDGGEAGGGRRAPVTLDVSVLAITDLAPFHIGLQRGFFADEGLEVRPRPAAQGAVSIAAVQSGDSEFGWTSTTSMIIARSKGLKLKFVTRGPRGPARRDQPGGAHVMVKRESPFRTLTDLEGKTIGVPLLRSIPTLTTSRAFEKQGVDPRKVKFIEVPFPQALPVLESGRADAVYVVEPFATAARQAGHRTLSYPLLETAPNYIVAGFFTTDKYIAESPEIVDRFARAVHRSFDYAAAHPQAVRDVIPTYTQIPPRVAQRTRLWDFSRYTDISTIELTAELAKKYGYIKGTPKLSEFVYQP